MISARPSLTWLTLFLALNACVSVRLGAPDFEKAEKIQVSAPGPGFKEIFLKDLDSAWRHSNTGDTAGLFTECNPENKKTLAEIRRGLLAGFDEAKIISESEDRFDSTQKLRTLVETRELKTKSYTDLAIYKNENCVYIATYVSLQQQKENPAFDRFLKEIEGQL